MNETANSALVRESVIFIPEASFTNITTNDVLMQARVTPNWKKEYIQISHGYFEGTLSDISIGPAQLFRETMNRAVDQHAQARQNCFTVGIPLRTEDGGFWCGDKLESDSILF